MWDRQSDSMSVRDYVQAASSGKRSHGMVQFPDHPLYKEHAPQHTRYWEIIGTCARRARVKEVIPWFDGGVLDILIDYLTTE